jgi:hypothetical protein
MAEKKISIWDIIAWIVLVGILVWLLLKTFRIINTPLWLEYAPLYGAVYIAGWQIHKLAIVSNDVKDLKNFKDQTISQIHNIKTNCLIKHKK